VLSLYLSPSPFSFRLCLTFKDTQLQTHAPTHTQKLNILCTHVQTHSKFRYSVLSAPCLTHTQPPSTSAYYLFLISLPLSGIILILLFSHLPPIGGPVRLGVQQTTVIHLVSAEIINTPSMPQHHE